jgi:hypothetical protein
MRKTGGQYLPTFALCKSFSEYLPAVCVASHDGGESTAACALICFCLQKTGAETYEMLQAAFGQSCPSQWKTFEWYSHFKSGRQSFEDRRRPGRISTSHIEETMACVREIIHAD